MKLRKGGSTMSKQEQGKNVSQVSSDAAETKQTGELSEQDLAAVAGGTAKIELQSFQWGVGSQHIGGGAGAGKVSIQD